MLKDAGLPRRRFLQIVAGGTAALALGSCGENADKRKKLTPYVWEGSLLGAETNLTLYHEHDAASIAAIKEITAEVKRLAGIFTIYVFGSELSRLNKSGMLAPAAPEMLEILDVSRRLWRESDGLFDPTIQPLWELYADYYATPRAPDDPGPSPEAIATARAKVGLDKVLVDDGSIRLAVEGMALSFNGIVQGYLTDRAHEILRKRGFDHALINMGEYRALGGKPQQDGSVKPWQIGIADAEAPWRVFETLEVTDRAVSTSSPSGAVFNTGGDVHHIFNPKTGLSANRYHSVTVTAPTATIADGLSTVLTVVPPEKAPEILSKFEGAAAFLRPLEGDPIRIGL
ncbi:MULTISPECIES: FAD:protein FMN transferase [Kordiimonas]|jgi:thiamine biosynthesis lipoprotein|uniref:FAD:protein FMN transferase n=1 Tax=Kordiimonas TaxID=288021 RepID=UPI002579E773|nr:FAD:protein FMN transferase [Kordiimonas sp. UBA4487]